MKIFEKGTQVHATEVLYANNNVLYTDPAYQKQLTPVFAAKLTPAKAVFSDGTNYLPIQQMAIDGTSIKINNVTYNVTNEA